MLKDWLDKQVSKTLIRQKSLAKTGHQDNQQFDFKGKITIYYSRASVKAEL